MLKAKLIITFLIVLGCSLALAGCKEGAKEIAKPATEAAEAQKLAEAEETMPWWSPPGLSTEGSEERMARMRERWEDMSEQERERFRARIREQQERWENMSEEQKEEFQARMRERRERWENMSEEEREEFRARRRERRERWERMSEEERQEFRARRREEREE